LIILYSILFEEIVPTILKTNEHIWKWRSKFSWF